MTLMLFRQGIGAPPAPVVKEGDTVKRGQVIAEAIPDALSVSLHAPVSGKVVELTEELIRIEPSEESSDDYVKMEAGESVADTVRKAGLIGLGGAGFPTYVKLNTQLKEGGYILCNAAECEPVLSHNIRQMEEETEKLISGMRLAMESTGAEKGIIGIKFKHRETIKQLTGYLREQNETSIRVLPLRNVYPVGEERALIRDTLNILLPAGALPVEANAVVFNVETLCAIHDAVEEHKPFIDKWITVAGKLKDIPHGEVRVLKVPLGTQLKTFIDQFGGIDEPYGEILVGGPYTGRRSSEDAYLQKVNGSVIVTAPFDKEEKKLGIIQCACGPLEDRLREIAKSLGCDEPVGLQVCKNAMEQKVGYKCQDPGNCPGQAEKVLALKKLGAEAVLIGHCTDCTNTVMGSAPQLGMEVHHCTDNLQQTMGRPLIRTFDESVL